MALEIKCISPLLPRIILTARQLKQLFRYLNFLVLEAHRGQHNSDCDGKYVFCLALTGVAGILNHLRDQLCRSLL